MQPYFFPYIGYFQLMNAVDEFVIYDNIEFSKGWVNRNRILVNGIDAYITVPLKKESDYLNVCERHLADSWPTERRKLLNRITESYRKAPYFAEAFSVIEHCILSEEQNLFAFLHSSLLAIKSYLAIATLLSVSSSIGIDHTLKGAAKVMALCKAKKAAEYFNPIGGIELYQKENFKKEELELHFLKANDIAYPQFENQFVPFLSIVDVIMFNSKVKVKEYLSSYTLL